MSSPGIHSAEVELDLSRYELRRAGQRVRLERQPMELLILLVERHGQLVTREEIVARLWGDHTFLDTERSINSAIRKIRIALRDDPADPRFLQTVVGKGYRIIAPIKVIPRQETAQPASEGMEEREAAARQAAKEGGAGTERQRSLRSPALMGAAALAVVITLALAIRGEWFAKKTAQGAIRSIAVLPLANLSGDPSQEYFADGVTEELTTDLAKIASLKVISRTSTTGYRDTRKPLRQIAHELGVDAVVEGSVARLGNRVRITAQLIDASNDHHIWADSYERDVTEVLSVQSSVAQEIASQVRTAVSPEEQQRLGTQRKVNPTAYEAYLRGRYLLTLQTQDGRLKALAEFQRSVDLDPTYAPAYAGLADTYALFANYFALPPKDAFPHARAAAAKALQLDPNLAEAHASLGIVKTHFDWDWSGAEREFREAIRLSPSYSLAHLRYSWYLSLTGRHDEAIAEANRAHELDPLSILISANIGTLLYYARRYDEAILQLQKTLELDPKRPWARVFLGLALDQKGKYQEAIEQLQEAKLELGLPEFVDLAHVYAAARRRDEALAMVRRIELQDLKNNDPSDWCFIAGVYAAMGDKRRAFEYLDRAYRERDFALSFLKVDPWMDPLRSDRRFASMLRRIGLQ